MIRRAMQGHPTTIMRSETMDWHTRLPGLMERSALAAHPVAPQDAADRPAPFYGRDALIGPEPSRG